MKFSEFETASDKAARVYKKKQADKEKETKQREYARRKFNDKVVKKVTSNLLPTVYNLLSNDDGNLLKASTIKADII